MFHRLLSVALLNVRYIVTRRNHMCQIFSKSVQGLHCSDIPKIMPFPIDLLRRPYNSVCTAVRHCEMYTSRTFIYILYEISQEALQNK